MKEMNIAIIFPVFTGLLAGWLVNYLSDVLPRTRRFSQPVCLHCDTSFSITQYLSLSNCPTCGNRRGLRAWIAQFLAIVASILLWYQPHPKLGYFLGFFLLIYFAVVFVIDLEHRLILHPVSIFGAILGLGVGWLLRGPGPTLLGGLAGFGIMLSRWGCP